VGSAQAQPSPSPRFPNTRSMRFPRWSVVAHALLLSSLRKVVRADRPSTGVSSTGDGAPIKELVLPDELAWQMKLDKFHPPVNRSCGSVYRAQVICDQEVVIKKPKDEYYTTSAIKHFWNGSSECYRNEMRFLKHMKGKSAYVASLVRDSGMLAGSRPVVVMEDFKSGTLHDRLFVETLPHRGIFFWQLLKGVQDMHSSRVIHMDISLQNALVHCEVKRAAPDRRSGYRQILETNCYAAHTDLGNACGIDRGDCPAAGTPPYIAPEVLEGRSVGIPANDVWSMGVLLHYLFLFKPPSFHTEDRNALKAKMKAFDVATDDYISLCSKLGGKVTQKVVEILGQVLVYDHTKRLTVEQFLTQAGELMSLAGASREEDKALVEKAQKAPKEYRARLPVAECLKLPRPNSSEEVCPLEVGATGREGAVLELLYQGYDCSDGPRESWPQVRFAYVSSFCKQPLSSCRCCSCWARRTSTRYFFWFLHC